MEENQSGMRFGIMVDSMTIEQWQADTIKQLISNGINLALIIRNDEKAPKQGFFKKIRNYPYRKMFFQVWNHYFFKPECKKRVALNEVVEPLTAKLLPCLPMHQGTSTFLSNHDVEIIKEQKLDFILRFGFNIIGGEILEAARHGIWSFHHDDEMEYRGAPPGFWEFMQDNPVNGIVLQRLTESLDKGIILRKAHYPTILHSYKAHLNNLYFESSIMPLQVCREIQALGTPQETPSQSTAKIYKAPRNSQMLKYWWLCFSRRLRFHLHDTFRQEDWDVAYADIPLHEFIKEPEAHLKEFKWFRRKRGNVYYADPFVITTNKDTYIFFESYDYKQGKGCIDISLKSEDFKKHHTALEEPFHLSYPFVFQYDGNVYCIPEANESNQVALYRFDEEQRKLVRDSVLMDGIRAVDPTLYYKDGVWNLFLSTKEHSNVKLYRYLADDLRGPYRPYYNNPVKTDCRDARMAGAFIESDGRLLRPGQESIRYYGTAVCLNEVTTLTNNQYSETEVQRIAPIKKMRFRKGLHSLNGNDTLTVIDGKRFYFTFSGMSHQLKLKAQREQHLKSNFKA